MNDFRVLIVENDASAAGQISLCLANLGYQVVGITTSCLVAKQLYQWEQPDITLIDIQEGRARSSMDLAHFIRSQPKPKPFIFISSRINHHCIRLARKTLPAGFLAKPIRRENLYATIELAMQEYRMQSQAVTTVIFSRDGNFHRIPVDSILYLQADHIYAQIFTIGGNKIIQRKSLTDLMEQLPTENFVQTHRSFVINIQHLNRWDKHHVYVGECAVPVSRGRRKQVLGILESVLRNAS